MCINTTVYWYTLSNPKVEDIYNNFLKKIESRDIESQIDVLQIIQKRLSEIWKENNLSESKKVLIKDIEYLNKKALVKRIIKSKQSKKDTDNWSSSKETIIKDDEVFLSNSTKEKIKSFWISQYFENISYDKNNIFLRDGIWYAYIFDKHLFFKDSKHLNLSNLEFNNINPKSDLLFVTWADHAGFAQEYTTVKLIEDEILNWIQEKYEILLKIKKDQTKVESEVGPAFENLKETVNRLTNNLSREAKIQALYDYIVQNIEYTRNIDLNDRKIFSGIETFIHKDGVCEWYAELFNYMLKLAGITDSEVITGFVIDAPDFPNIWHAWVKIGDRYYDPTFDDPVGITWDPTPEEYKYYNLPKDLFYTNRFTYGDTPDSLKVKWEAFRKDLVKLNLSKLADKYEDKDFNLLKPFKFRKEHQYSYNEKIDIDNYSNIWEIYTVKNFSYTDNLWEQKRIQTLKYYTIERGSDKLENILEQIWYNLDWYILFKWLLENGTHEYRLGYDIVFN